jgi:predicted RNA binding protein YcfA (HicA-like mRNA interferase family)
MPYLVAVKPHRLLVRIRRGDLENVRFKDFARLVEAVGFVQVRQKGSHRVYRKGDSVLNLQDVRGRAKPYQIRQFLRTMDEQGLELESRDD